MDESAQDLPRPEICCLEADCGDVTDAVPETMQLPKGEDVETAWRKEVAARIAELGAGDVETIAWEQVRSRLVASLRERYAAVDLH